MANFSGFILISVLAIGGGAFDIPKPETSVYSTVVDTIVLNMLDSLRTTLENLKIPDLNETAAGANFNFSMSMDSTNLTGAKDFENPILETTLIPVEVNNLTLTWKEVDLESNYLFDAIADLEEMPEIVHVYGDGKARLNLHDVWFTIGAKFKLSSGKIEIIPKGLYNFDVRVRTANVTLGRIMGDKELGKVLGIYLSHAIPGFVDAIKFPLFNAHEDYIIELLNYFINNSGSKSGERRSSDVNGTPFAGHRIEP